MYMKEQKEQLGNVLGTFGKVAYNIGRGIYDYIADNQFNPQNYYFTKNEPIRHNAPMPIKQPKPGPPRNPDVLPPITRQHEKREIKEDLGNPYEFWTRGEQSSQLINPKVSLGLTRQGMRDGG